MTTACKLWMLTVRWDLILIGISSRIACHVVPLAFSHFIPNPPPPLEEKMTPSLLRHPGLNFEVEERG